MTGSQDLSDRDQTSSDRDQTASDSDQTWADHDQSASERDQRSADEDQRASDEDLAAGGDRMTHDRSHLARERSSGDRRAVSEARADDASARLDTAADRDHVAETRDREAEARDAAALLTDVYDERAGHREDLVLRARQDRIQAAADRATAADDRRRAAADRAEAAQDRAEADRQRAEAGRELELAITDPLTGAHTRQFGLREVELEIERAHRTGGRLVLAFIDLDRLKELNDTEGHPAGDDFLQTVGAILRAHMRPYDVISRVGGDEFVCAMPNVTAAAARRRLEQMRPALAAGERPRSISFGLAELQPGDDLEQLVARADQALLSSRRRRDVSG